MTQVVLTFDPSLGHMFHNFPLLSFLPCAPVRFVPPPIYRYLSRPEVPADEYGRAILAPYGIRKLEACLKKRSTLRAEVVHPKYLERHIREDTELIAVNTMDPLGIGPLTIMFNNCGREKSWVAYEFETLIHSINVLRRERCPKAKLVVGGAGEWEFEIRPEMIDAFEIDHVVQGEMDDIVHLLFEQLIEDSLDNSIFFHGFKSTVFDRRGRATINYVKDPQGRFITRNPFSKYKLPKISDIPTIVGGVISGQVEIMRGCGLDCDFCEVTTRPLRYYPPEKVLEEVKVNLRYGVRNAWFITDNQWAYMLRDPDYWPNKEAIERLYRTVMSYNGVVHANPMHATIAPPAADPELVMMIAKLVRAGPGKHIGVQIGLETGSDRLVLKHMNRKALPFRVGVDATWTEIVIEGQKALNAAYWLPAYTIIFGLSGETDEDVWDTIGLINYMASQNLLFTVTPMALVSLGSLRGNQSLTDVYANLTPAQAALIYVSWRNTKRMAELLAWRLGKDNPLLKLVTGGILTLGANFWLNSIERYFRKFNPEAVRAIEKAKNYMEVYSRGTDFNKLRERFKEIKSRPAILS
ncbi:MAG: radical SAM protein [Nitrososphaerota archaeon]|nr:B12-binding domain-containing radical SAM protein [Candidatus Calditenuaceae archaeon]MDW8073666.1 radical SAM protein [Nitrososphaerota archaeon]